MRVLLPEGLTLELDAAGEGAPVLLIHGFGGCGSAWGPAVLEGLAGHTRTLAVDLIGHGRSDDPPGPDRVSLDRVLDDLERALDAAGVAACPWIGYSMGGRIALAAALLRPERVSRIVLESASPGLPGEAERRARREQDEALAARIERIGVAAWVEEWERGPLFAGRQRLPAAELEAFRAQRRANRAASLSAWLCGLGTGAQPSFWDRLGGIRQPALLLSGADDERYSAIAREMQTEMHRARHVEVPGAGHTVHLEQPEAWLRAVLAFLSD